MISQKNVKIYFALHESRFDVRKGDTESIRVTKRITLVVDVELLNNVDSEHVALLRLAYEGVLAQLNHVLDEEACDFEEILALLVCLA